MIIFKEGVGWDFSKIRTMDYACDIMEVAERIWEQEFGRDCVVTSLMGGEHSRNSKHYSGEAVDIRSRDLEEDQLDLAMVELQKQLGDAYDVVLEPTHIHIEYDPH